MALLSKLHPGIQQWIKEQNWPGLRPIQEKSIKPILDGLNCVIEAPTAGGKTEAVLFPALTRAAKFSASSIQVLYIAPLRALLNNLENRGEKYARCCGLHAFKWHGDVSQSDKLAQLAHPPNLLMTTPESIEAILLRKSQWRIFFKDIQTVIIDEAHNFAAGDRGGHLMALLERLNTATGQEFQRIALSATIGNPEAMCQWLTGTRKPAQRIQVSSSNKQKTDYKIHYFDSSIDTLDTPPDKTSGWHLLKTMVSELRGCRSIVFVGSRSKAENFAKAIQSFPNSRINLRTHHSSVSKFFREEAEALIQEIGEQGIEAILSTSTLELGIDIGELDKILQLDALSSPSAFLQRVGRTGRRKNIPRYFRGLVRDIDGLLLMTATLSLGVEYKSEAIQIKKRAFQLLAHQLICLSLQQHGIQSNKVWDILRHATPFSGIRRKEYDHLIQHMIKEEYLRTADGVLVPGESTENRYLKAGWRKLFAVFNTAPLYEVIAGRNQIGTLDASFVEAMSVPFFFTLAGRLWKAEKVDMESHRIKAVHATTGHAPKWESFGGPGIPFETANRVGEILYGYKNIPEALDESAFSILNDLQSRRLNNNEWSPNTICILLTGKGKANIITYAGDLINQTWARLLESESLKTRGNYAEIMVEKKQNGKDLKEIINSSKDQILSHQFNDQLSNKLIQNQPAWPFSPFAAMLPESLIKEALAESTTDLKSLREYLKNKELKFF